MLHSIAGLSILFSLGTLNSMVSCAAIEKDAIDTTKGPELDRLLETNDPTRPNQTQQDLTQSGYATTTLVSVSTKVFHISFDLDQYFDKSGGAWSVLPGCPSAILSVRKTDGHQWMFRSKD